MNKELLANIRNILIPTLASRLKKTNYEGQGEKDAIEFTHDMTEIFDLAEQQLSAQRWVLATPETMPDSYEIVYVTVSIEKRRYVTKGVVANGKWVGNFGGGRVVAWMPITYPKPYNGELDG